MKEKLRKHPFIILTMNLSKSWLSIIGSAVIALNTLFLALTILL
jgi:hypothetical protein